MLVRVSVLPEHASCVESGISGRLVSHCNLRFVTACPPTPPQETPLLRPSRYKPMQILYCAAMFLVSVRLPHGHAFFWRVTVPCTNAGRDPDAVHGVHDGVHLAGAGRPTAQVAARLTITCYSCDSFDCHHCCDGAVGGNYPGNLKPQFSSYLSAFATRFT